MAVENKMFKTVEQMSELTGIGARTIREMIQAREIDYLKIGNRYLLTEQAFKNWYENAKVAALTAKK